MNLTDTLLSHATSVCRFFAENLHAKGHLSCSVEEAMTCLSSSEERVVSKAVSFSPTVGGDSEPAKPAAKLTVQKKPKVSKKSSPSEEKTASVGAKKKSGASKCPKKPRFLLPFCGKVVDSWCEGIRFSGGLHTQCTSRKPVNGEYCSACKGNAAKGTTGKPNYGNIHDRTSDDEYLCARTGEPVARYANIAATKNIDLEEAVKVAAEYGWVITPVQLSVDESLVKTKKGKVKSAPKKVDIVAELVSKAAKEIFNDHDTDAEAESSGETKSETVKPTVEVKLEVQPTVELEVQPTVELEVQPTVKASLPNPMFSQAPKSTPTLEDNVGNPLEVKQTIQDTPTVDSEWKPDMKKIFGDDTDDEEEEGENEVELSESMKVTIKGTDYYMAPAHGYDAVLFEYPNGEDNGLAYDEETGTITAIDI